MVELCIDGHPSLHVEGTVTITLPEYMNALPEEHLREAKTSDNLPNLILAAGRHPRTHEIVFITGIGEIRSIDTVQFGIPPGKVWPKNHGQELHIEMPEDFDDIDVGTDWAMRVSQMLINVGTMADKRGARITYLDE